MRDDKLMALHGLADYRKKYDTCVQDVMRKILMYLFYSEKKDARYNRHIYAVTFSAGDDANRNRIAIMCNLSPLENEDLNIMIKQYMESMYYPEVTMLIYDFNNNELDKIMCKDIYPWIKNVYPHCRFTVNKEFLSAVEKEVTIYHYVIGK